MKRNSRYLLTLLLLFSLFFLVSCLPSTYDSTKGTIKGRIMVPSSPTKDITGWVHLPNAMVTLIDSEGNTHTVNTNSNGYYTIFEITPGTNYVLTATGEVAGNTVILKDFVPQVEAGKNYDAGTADCESTALALVVEALLNEGIIPEDIDPEQIRNTDNFLNLVSQVCLLLEQNGDVTSDSFINSQVEEVVEEILPSVAPSPSSTSPNSSPYIPGSNANLSSLTVSESTLIPDFNTDTIDYTVTVAYSVDSITFTPTAIDNKATITVNGSSVTSGSTSSPISLNIGDNPITIIVTAEDGITQKAYTVIVNRSSPSSNANLSKLDIKYISGVVSERNIKDPIYPAFDFDTDSYILHLVGTEDDIEIVPTVEDTSASAVVLYNGGLCVYFIQVTAEDRTTQNNYAIQAYFYDSINAALEGNSTLTDGHMVTVVPGTYQEEFTIDFPDKAIRLQSIDPEDNIVRKNTIIQGDGATYRVFSFDELSNLGSGTNLTGFTIQKGYASDNGGGGIAIYQSSPTITYNTISENNSYNGGGIYIGDHSLATITNNTISGNGCKNRGGGISIYSSSPIVTDNTVSGNTGEQGGGISIYSSLPTITNNTISGNKCADDGGGIYITTSSSPDIKSNTISENGCGDKGSGIYIAGTTSSPAIGGSDEKDTKNFNTICGNIINNPDPDSPDQVYPNKYPFNYICDSCDKPPCCDHCQ